MKPYLTFKPIAPDNGFRMDDYWIWCPSVVRGPEGRYHMFASRWPKRLPFHPGWLTHSEVVRAVADREEGPYAFAEVVLPRRGPEYWDGRTTHNPTVREFNGRYYLYYMGTTYPFPRPSEDEDLPKSDPRAVVARWRKRIGMAWADSPEGPWHRSDEPILYTKPGTFYNFLTSNPAPWIDPETGAVKMVFKSRIYDGDSHGPMKLGLAVADWPEGPYSVVGDRPLFEDGLFDELEDPFLWREGGRFHLVAKDMRGTTTGQKGGAVHAVSEDSQRWEQGQPVVAWQKSIPFEDGTRMACGSMERPFLIGDGEKHTHLCAAVSDGTANFRDARNTWNAVIPLQ